MPTLSITPGGDFDEGVPAPSKVVLTGEAPAFRCVTGSGGTGSSGEPAFRKCEILELELRVDFTEDTEERRLPAVAVTEGGREAALAFCEMGLFGVAGAEGGVSAFPLRTATGVGRDLKDLTETGRPDALSCALLLSLISALPLAGFVTTGVSFDVVDLRELEDDGLDSLCKPVRCADNFDAVLD